MADLASHLLAAIFLKNSGGGGGLDGTRLGHGVFFVWHAVKYVVGQTNVPRVPAYILDIADCLLWQAAVFSFSSVTQLLPPAIVHCLSRPLDAQDPLVWRVSGRA